LSLNIENRVCVDPECHPDCGKDVYHQPWIIKVNGEIVTSCKSSWGFCSCSFSPGNKKRLSMSEKERIKASALLFPIMDVEIYFKTIFGEEGKK